MKKKYLNVLLIITIGLLLIIGTKGGYYLFGSDIDWFNQHLTFATYFRSLFYETGHLFPNFLLHLGSGINLFSLAYYGLFSPWLLLSFCFPFLSMTTYLQIINIVTYLGTVIFFYFFLEHKKIPSPIALVTSLLFLTASPLLYHFHKQFMFVNYFPFLILGFYGVESFLRNHKTTLLTISTFLIFLTSFYYGIPCLFVLVLYYSYLKYQDKKTTLKTLFQKEFVYLLLAMGLGILLASFLLLPAFSSIMSGRSGMEKAFPITSLLPDLSGWNLLYHSYTMGLSLLCLLALIVSLFSSKKEEKVLSISLVVLLTIPLISYLLNGGLYIRGKVFIPFIPLVLLLTACFLEKLEKKKETLPWKRVGLLLLIPILIVFFTHMLDQNYLILFIFDVIFTYLALVFYQKKKKYECFLIYPLLITIPLCIVINRSEAYVSMDTNTSYEENEIRDFVMETETKDNSLYRMNTVYDVFHTMNQVYSSNYYTTSLYGSVQNPSYRKFYFDIMKNPQSEENYLMLANSLNPLFLSYMGVKYVIAENTPLGYTLQEEGSSLNLYQSDQVLPLFYASDQLFPTSLFNSLKYTDNIATLLEYAVVDTVYNTSFTQHLQEVDLGLSEQLEGLHIILNDKETKKVSLNKNIKDKVLLLSFDLTKDSACKESDRRIIEINGVTNQESCDLYTYGNRNHTFYYPLGSNDDLSSLTLTFTKGAYELTNVKTYLLDMNLLTNYQKRITPMENIEVKEDYIEGTITAKKNSYFITSIPYDAGFTVLVDGVNTPYEIVNTAFLGFPISEGSHKIEISYQAPLFKEGKIISGITLLFVIGVYIKENHFISNKKTKRKVK